MLHCNPHFLKEEALKEGGGDPHQLFLQNSELLGLISLHPAGGAESGLGRCTANPACAGRGLASNLQGMEPTDWAQGRLRRTPSTGHRGAEITPWRGALSPRPKREGMVRGGRQRPRSALISPLAHFYSGFSFFFCPSHRGKNPKQGFGAVAKIRKRF